MAWSERNWGFRGDVRYYRTTSNNSDVLDLNNIGDGSIFSRVELSGISFWKANAGLVLSVVRTPTSYDRMYRYRMVNGGTGTFLSIKSANTSNQLLRD